MKVDGDIRTVSLIEYFGNVAVVFHIKIVESETRRRKAESTRKEGRTTQQAHREVIVSSFAAHTRSAVG